MKCPNCGYENPEGASFCNFCGKSVAIAPAVPTHQPSDSQYAPSPESSELPRHCVSCGRSIPWAANVCPYCGHDYRMPTFQYPQQETITPGLRAVFYILSFLIPIAGIIIGIVYYVKPDPESKRVGRNCILIAVIVWVSAALLAILLYALVLGVAYELPVLGIAALA